MTDTEKIAALKAENRDLRARLAAVSAAGKALSAVEMEASPDVDEFFDVLAKHGFDQGEVSVGRAALTELAEQIDAAAAGGGGE